MPEDFSNAIPSFITDEEVVKMTGETVGQLRDILCGYRNAEYENYYTFRVRLSHLLAELDRRGIMFEAEES